MKSDQDQVGAAVLRGMSAFVTEWMLPLLKPPKGGWQPADYFPDAASEDWGDRCSVIRTSASGLPDDLLVSVVGNTVTEEALPSYQSWVNRLRGIGDATGTDEAPWARWIRAWSAEENRHGDVLNRYLYLCGRVDMRSVEITVQNLIRNGFNAGIGDDPYMGLIYTAFQETATKLSHSAAGVRARREGDELLGRICCIVASDEARHQIAYIRAVKEIFRVDADGAVVALKRTFRPMASMPGLLMDDGRTDRLYAAYSAAANRAGVYGSRDFALIVGSLVRTWDVGGLTGLSSDASEAQEFVCRIAERYERLVDSPQERPVPAAAETYPWIHRRRTAFAS